MKHASGGGAVRLSQCTGAAEVQGGYVLCAVALRYDCHFVGPSTETLLSELWESLHATSMCCRPTLCLLCCMQVLLFSTMPRALDVVSDYLDWRGFKHLRLDGGTSAGERGELVRQFNGPGRC